MREVVSPKAAAAKLTELWSPRVIAALDDSFVKVAKVRDSLAWHGHDGEDELFLAGIAANRNGRAQRRAARRRAFRRAERRASGSAAVPAG